MGGRRAQVKDVHEVNRTHWDAVTPVHVNSDLYDLDALVDGVDHLDPTELEAVGDVDGRTLLHLQCHIGTDTLSWARRGAHVTGVDFSAPALAEAHALTRRLGLEERARWVESDVLTLAMQETFDVVYTGRGAIPWLSDLDEWGRVIARHLKPGGTFFMQEFHPTGQLFDPDTTRGLVVRDPYFRAEDGAPYVFPDEPDYADPSFIAPTIHAWVWTLSDVFNALWKAGLQVVAFEEHPFTRFKQFDRATESPDLRWNLPDDMPAVPLMYDVKAVKPA